jgi:hypothetical protein
LAPKPLPLPPPWPVTPLATLNTGTCALLSCGSRPSAIAAAPASISRLFNLLPSSTDSRFVLLADRLMGRDAIARTAIPRGVRPHGREEPR